MEKLKLVDLIDVEALQRIQDGFSKYTGMAALTTDVDGTPITQGSGFTRFCMELTRKSAVGCKKCEKCDSDGAFMTLEKGKATAYVCHAGLMDFAAPIMIEGKVIGSFIGGQVRIGEIDEAEMVSRANEYGIDPKEYVEASNETSLTTKEAVEEAAEFISELASGLSLMAYKNYLELKESERMERVAKSQAEYIMNMSMNLERVMDRWLIMVENASSNANAKDMETLLDTIQNDGFEIRGSIRDTISFIKMSANEVEISETTYTVSQLLDMTRDASNGNTEISTGTIEKENLFGDVARIAQMIAKIVKVVSRDKDKNIEVVISTIHKQYATCLNVEITDRDSKYTKKDIKRFNSFFASNAEMTLEESDDSGTWLTLEAMLLKVMSGTIDAKKVEGDLVVEISIPQIGLQE